MTRCTIPSLEEADIRESIRAWLKLLTDKRFSEAAAYLTPHPKVTYCGEELKDCIGQYSPEYRDAPFPEREQHRPEVTDPDLLDLEGERLEIYPVDDGTFVTVEHAVPLDGVWSDLTAIFDLFPIPEGWSLALYDMRVM